MTLFACVALFAQLSTVGHLALVEHHVCAEHGEWSHPGASPLGGEKSDAHATGARNEHESSEGSEKETGHGEHEHCSCIAEKQSFPAPASLHVEHAVTELGAPPRPSIVEADEPSRQSVYLYAPKTSPPI